MVGLDTGYYDGCDFVAAPDPVPSFDVDLRDVEPAHLDGFDAVVHLAALSNDPLSDINPELTYDINLHASVRLAERGEDGGGRALPVLVVVQPLRRGGDELLDETAAFNPVTPYGESKVRVEHAVAELADDSLLARPTCATRRPTGYPGGCVPTSSSTTSSAMR